jgi:histidinol-phosphate aminotransferase
VLRTLSKAWGLAGLRIGYLVGQPAVAGAVRKVITPFSTSALAQAAALAALRADDEMRRRAALVVSERERVFTALRTWLPEVPPTQANFVWLPLGSSSSEGRGARTDRLKGIPLGDRAGAFASACESAGVIVRAFAGDGVRVTVGLPEENETFLAVAEKFLA